MIRGRGRRCQEKMRTRYAWASMERTEVIMGDTLTSQRSLPLTDLCEDEAMFRDAVRALRGRARAPARARDGRGREDPARAHRRAASSSAIMGIEIPEAHGGAGATFFMSILAVEELARVDASVAVLVDVQNTLVNNALLRWGNDEQKARYFPKLATQVGGRLRALRGGLGLGRLRAGLPRHRPRRPLRADRPQALDHQRRRGRALHRPRHRRSRQGLQGHHRLPGRAHASPASRWARRRTSSASAPPPPAS